MSAATVEEIRRRLLEALLPVTLEVFDEGDKHAGHANEGKGHYRVRIVSAVFAGMPSLKRHRTVYATLGELMDSDIHALSIDARAQSE